MEWRVIEEGWCIAGTTIRIDRNADGWRCRLRALNADPHPAFLAAGIPYQAQDRSYGLFETLRQVLEAVSTLPGAGDLKLLRRRRYVVKDSPITILKEGSRYFVFDGSSCGWDRYSSFRAVRAEAERIISLRG